MDLKANFNAIFDILKDPKSKWLASADFVGSKDNAISNFAIPMIGLSLVPLILYSFLLAGFQFLAIPVILVSAILQFIFLFLIAWYIGFLAPKFDGNPNYERCFQYACLSASIGWLGAMLGIIPLLGNIVAFVLYLYGIYVNYHGVTPVLGVPKDKSIVFYLVFIGTIIIAFFLLYSLVFSLLTVAGLGVASSMGIFNS